MITCLLAATLSLSTPDAGPNQSLPATAKPKQAASAQSPKPDAAATAKPEAPPAITIRVNGALITVSGVPLRAQNSVDYNAMVDVMAMALAQIVVARERDAAEYQKFLEQQQQQKP